jgi:hypothetical protein
MPRSDWRRYDQIVIALGTVAIGCLLLFVTWELSATNAAYTHDADQAAQSYAESTQARISRTCTYREVVAFTKCVREQAKADQEAHTAQYYLAAQNRMALWAMWTFIVSAFSLGVTGLGIYFVWRTLGVSLSAIASDREVGEAQVRAYITPTEPRLGFDGDVPVLEFKLVNSGNSPAFEIDTFCSFGYGFRGDTPAIDDSVAGGVLVATLRQGETTRPMTIFLGRQIVKQQADANFKMLMISLVLRIRFRDVFRKPQNLNVNYMALVKNWPEDLTTKLYEVDARAFEPPI